MSQNFPYVLYVTKNHFESLMMWYSDSLIVKAWYNSWQELRVKQDHYLEKHLAGTTALKSDILPALFTVILVVLSHRHVAYDGSLRVLFVEYQLLSLRRPGRSEFSSWSRACASDSDVCAALRRMESATSQSSSSLLSPFKQSSCLIPKIPKVNSQSRSRTKSHLSKPYARSSSKTVNSTSNKENADPKNQATEVSSSNSSDYRDIELEEIRGAPPQYVDL